MAISSVSFNKTPQAGNDSFSTGEDSSLVLDLDVMANDLGGNAKKLYSLDDGNVATDLLAKDAVGGVQYSAAGAAISITADGKVHYDASALAPDLQSLAQGEIFQDSFTYAIQLGNGTLSWATATIQIVGTNDGPVARADTAEVSEDAVITGSVATNDSDIDHGAVLSYALNAPVDGLTFNPDGSYSFDAGHAAYQHLAQGATAEVVAAYTVTDEHGASAVSTLTITLTGTNDGPVAAADAGSGAEDAVISGSVAGNDSDVDDGAVLSYSLDAPVAGLAVDASGDYGLDASDAAYQHLAQGATLDVVAGYTATDEHGASASSSLTITLTGMNDGPVAQADANAAAEDTVITGSVAGNDSDVDDGALLSYSLDAPVVGLTLNSDGSYSFDAGDAAYQSLNTGDSLDVTASYTVSDEWGASASATLTITIAGASDQAVASLPPVFTGGGDPNDQDSQGAAGGQSLGTNQPPAGNQTQTLFGGAGNDTLTGGNGGDFLIGGSGDDVLNGNNGPDVLFGGSGNDSLSGGNAPDFLIGGYGADSISGGNDADSILYLDVLDTGDSITGFVSGSDKLDLSFIDADWNLAGNQAFGWGGEQAGAFVEANSVTWYVSGGNAVVLADTDGDLANAEFSVTLNAVGSLGMDDFVL